MGRPAGPESGVSGAHRYWVVAVPILIAISLVLLVARMSFGGDTYQDCRYLGPSVRMYVTAWAAPLCSAAALSLLAALVHRRRKGGDILTAGGWGKAVTGAACLAPVLILAQLVVLYWTYAPDPAGGTGCSGAGQSLIEDAAQVTVSVLTN